MSTTKMRKKPHNATIDRPFDSAILRKALEIVHHYQVVMWLEDGEYYGRGLELPTAYGDGKTPDACMKDVREALKATVAFMLERGETPPPPAREKQRTEQVNIRLTMDEKMALEIAAKQHGFNGLSDYVRSTALSAKGG